MGTAAGIARRRAVGGLSGRRSVLDAHSALFPRALREISAPPEALYVIGNPQVLQEGLAVVGARKATPYGISCTTRFASRAAGRGVVIISGGARGCDAAAHRAALAQGCPTVAFLGGGCDNLYPAEHAGLFQRIIDEGGAVVSELSWDAPPLPRAFRARNRLIAGLARATLIVEAGLPSGTFSTADEALAAGKEVLCVPGAITSPASRGANRLIRQGATPIVDDDSFDDALFGIFGCFRQEDVRDGCGKAPREGRGRNGEGDDPLIAALKAEPLGFEQLHAIARHHCGSENPASWLAQRIAEAEVAGVIARYPDGRFGPAGEQR